MRCICELAALPRFAGRLLPALDRTGTKGRSPAVPSSRRVCADVPWTSLRANSLTGPGLSQVMRSKRGLDSRRRRQRPHGPLTQEPRQSNEQKRQHQDTPPACLVFDPARGRASPPAKPPVDGPFNRGCGDCVLLSSVNTPQQTVSKAVSIGMCAAAGRNDPLLGAELCCQRRVRQSRSDFAFATASGFSLGHWRSTSSIIPLSSDSVGLSSVINPEV